MIGSVVNTTTGILATLTSHIGDATQGLPEDVFLFLSGITPLFNVDLLIKNEAGQTLLTWRADQFYPESWHIPGGIVRFKEKITDRLAAVATNELGAGPPLVRREGVVLTFLPAGEVAGRPAAAHRPCPRGEEAGHPAGETHSAAGHPNLEEPAPQGLGGGNVGRDPRGPLLCEERLVSSTM